MGLEGATCTNEIQFDGGVPGGDVVYSVVLTANQAITVTLAGVSADYDPALAVVGPGTGATPAAVCDAMPITECVAGADANVGGMGETVNYTATTAGTYYIIVDSFYAGFSSFSGTSSTGGFTIKAAAN
jgi:hypothetical protein